jgi:hypothetical protein
MRRRQECFVFILFSLLFDLDLDLHLIQNRHFFFVCRCLQFCCVGGGEVRCRQNGNGAAY